MRTTARAPNRGPAWHALVLCWLMAAQAAGTLRVPRILHRNYMAGAEALYAATQDPHSGFKAHWLASCKTHNPMWQEIIWDEAAVMTLIQEDFPWFLPTFLSYPKLVQRSDVTRYMILYKHGGVYLDADVECYSNLEASLQNKDLVLNCEYPGQQGQLHNAAMASAPGHPFWLVVLKEAIQRAPAAAANNAAAGGLSAVGSNMLQGLQHLWERTPFHNKVNAVLRSTGPMMVTAAYQAYIGGGPMCGRSVNVDGRINHAYELGVWFTPCFFRDSDCQRKWVTQHFLLSGSRSEQQPQPAVSGIHHYSASWTDWDHSDKQQQEAAVSREAALRALEFFSDAPGFLQYNCTSELPTAQQGSSKGSSHVGGPIPLCMEYVLDAVSTHSCTMVSVLAVGAGEAAVGDMQQQHLAGSNVSTELLLKQLGCHIITVTPDKHPPQPLRVLQASYAGNSSSSSSEAGTIQHVHGLLRAVPEYDEEPPVVSLQSLLQLDARIPQQRVQRMDQQQQHSVTAAAAAASAVKKAPIRYILRLSCDGCELPVMRHLFESPAELNSILTKVELLIVDLQLSVAMQEAAAAGSIQARNQQSPSQQSSKGSSSIDGLDAVYNLLYQQHGFAGFLRQHLPGGVLRLGWVRHPQRMQARQTVFGDSMHDEQLLSQLAS